MVFNVRLKEIRKERQLSQKALAHLIDTNERTYQEYEYGKVKPSIEVLKRLCIALHVEADYLLGLKDKKD